MMEPGNIAQWVALAVAVSTTIYQAVSLRSKAAAEKVSDLERKTDAKFREVEGKVIDKASVGRMGALEERVDKVEDRVSRAESRLEHMPDRESSHRLELAINRLSMRRASVTRKMAEARALYEGIASQFDHQSADESAVVLGEFLKTLVLEIAETGGASAKEAMELSRAYQSILQGMKVSSDRRRKLQEEYDAKTKAVIDRVAEEGGLSAEIIGQLRRDFLGVRTKPQSQS